MPFVAWVGVGQDIIKGVYYALVLTVRNPEKISCRSGTKQRECPSWVCYIYTCLTLPYSHWCILLSPVCRVWRCDGHIYTYRRGASALLVSTGWAIPGASNREASDSAGLHAFLCLQVNVKNTHIVVIRSP